MDQSDYEGSLAAFEADTMSGYVTLDFIRAAVSASKFTTMPSSAQLAIYGYLGGLSATEWASELQAEHAPKLHFAVAGIGGAYPKSKMRCTDSATSVVLKANTGPPICGKSSLALIKNIQLLK
jgi:hypothetical protein